MDYEKLLHIDLFSGIGGFALAADRAFGNIEHIFCDIEPFSQAVLEKHWPSSKIYGDIRTLTYTSCEQTLATISGGLHTKSGVRNRNGRASTSDADDFHGTSGTDEKEAESRNESPQLISHGRNKSAPDSSSRRLKGRKISVRPSGSHETTPDTHRPYILTGGFPCQPFSQAGRRRGTEDDRHLWPEMLRVIREFHPRWIIGENVGGFVTWSGGLVLEQVHADLEAEGYEVQAFIIPAVAVNAPHRRDRIWIVAHSTSERVGGVSSKERGDEERIMESSKREGGSIRSESKGCAGFSNDTDSSDERLQGRKRKSSIRHGRQPSGNGSDEGWSWNQNWLEVATRLCRMDDGLPRRMDRTPRLKALGNAIVPQVAEEIMRAIKLADETNC